MRSSNEFKKQKIIALVVFAVILNLKIQSSNVASLYKNMGSYHVEDEHDNQDIGHGEILQDIYPPYLEPIEGGVLPIRRFTIAGGTLLKKIYSTSNTNQDTSQNEAKVHNLHLCNRMCLELEPCDAWEFQNRTRDNKSAPVDTTTATTHEEKAGQSHDHTNTTCLLFSNNNPKFPIDIHQAVNNNPRNIVGFVQKRARVLRSNGMQSHNTTGSELKHQKILYILHFHHEVIPSAFSKILNEILPSSWMRDLMDLVVITPREVRLMDDETSSSLVNPFSPIRKNETTSELVSSRGALGHMSLPIARAKFPGYGGYLLVNDDAMVKVWDLDRDIWFHDRPWGTFQPHQYTEQAWIPRRIKPRYPYGNYGWSWYNADSGTVYSFEDATRSNFDAALDAMNELCMNETDIVRYMDDLQVEEFCTNRRNNVLRPYVVGGGKADVLYVPGNDLGSLISKAMTLFGEHDVMMEIAYPIIMSAVVPREMALEMPLCDASIKTLKSEWEEGVMKFRPYFRLTREEGKKLDCPVIHPIKFGIEGSIPYWKSVLNGNCTWCIWHDDSQEEVFWKMIN